MLLLCDTRYAVAHPKGNVASGRAEEIRSFAQKNSQREFFCAKEKSVLCCRRRIWLPSGEMSRLNAHRVTPVM
jgi:hypothetical protein